MPDTSIKDGDKESNAWPDVLNGQGVAQGFNVIVEHDRHATDVFS
jgi:hypothetical protein